MAVSQVDINSLNTAIASGVRSATVGGQTVTYNTSASLIAARDDLKKQLVKEQNEAAGNKRNRQFLAYQSDRGY